MIIDYVYKDWLYVIFYVFFYLVLWDGYYFFLYVIVMEINVYNLRNLLRLDDKG